MGRVIYTAITNHYDTLKPPLVVTPGARYVAFLDDDDYDVPKPWTMRRITIQERNPRVTSRYYKMLPHRLFPKVEWSIWIDASLQLIRDLTPLWDIAGPLAAFPHPERDCVYEEAETVLYRGLTNTERLLAQIAAYHAIGYPVHQGLFQAGLMVRRHHDPVLVAAMEDWWEAIRCYSQRDQLSGMVALWQHGLTYEPLSGDIHDYVNYIHHVQPNAYQGGH